MAGAANLTDRATIHRALDDLSRSGVLTGFDGGTEPIWAIAPGQHLVAAFYRNTAVHVLVDRAIGELGLVAATEDGEHGLETANRETLRLRDLLKFDFFFPSRREFAREMAAELAIVDPRQADELHEFGPAEARRWLAESELLVAHLVLRPFLEAYHVVADRLAAWEDDEPFDTTRFLDECLRLGRQWALQKRVASEESVSLELFKPALRLAEHRGLLAAGPEMAKRRDDFREEMREMRTPGGRHRRPAPPGAVVNVTAAEVTAAVRAGDTGPEIGAFFDFDGTLVQGYTANSFYSDRIRNGEAGPLELARVLVAAVDGTLLGGDPQAIGRVGFATLRGRTVDEVAGVGERLFVEKIAGTIRPEARDLVRAHLRMGHTVVVASSATRMQIAPVARDLGITHMVCTELEEKDGVLTGRSTTGMLWGEPKAGPYASSPARTESTSRAATATRTGRRTSRSSAPSAGRTP